MESQPSLSNNAQFVYIYYFSIRQKVAQRLKKIKRIGEGGRKRIGVVIFFLFIIYVNMGRVRGGWWCCRRLCEVLAHKTMNTMKTNPAYGRQSASQMCWAYKTCVPCGAATSRQRALARRKRDEVCCVCGDWAKRRRRLLRGRGLPVWRVPLDTSLRERRIRV